MEDVFVFVFVEDANARCFSARKLDHVEVAFDFAYGQLLGSEGDVVVIVKITSVG